MKHDFHTTVYLLDHQITPDSIELDGIHLRFKRAEPDTLIEQRDEPDDEYDEIMCYCECGEELGTWAVTPKGRDNKQTFCDRCIDPDTERENL